MYYYSCGSNFSKIHLNTLVGGRLLPYAANYVTLFTVAYILPHVVMQSAVFSMACCIYCLMAYTLSSFFLQIQRILLVD